MSIEQPSQTQTEPEHVWLWFGPILYMLAIGIYFVCRYAGMWSEIDTAVFAKVIRAFIAEGKLVPTQGEVYPNGYAYPAIAAFIIAFTGLDVQTLQQIVAPLLAVVVVLPAWLLYRELTGSSRSAAFATILLLTQPEFLFVILRGSHEKFTRTLMLLCLFLFVRSFVIGNKPRLFALYVGLFYLPAFALTTSNNLLANSFFFALVLTLILGLCMELFSYLFLKRSTGEYKELHRSMLQRISYMLLACSGLVFLNIYYIYPPAQHNLDVLQVITRDSTTVVTHTAEQSTNNPYAVVSSGWIDLRVYMLVSIANWIMLGLSFILWWLFAIAWLHKRSVLEHGAYRLMWLLYAAFMLQGALSVIADMGGSMGGNIQHRLFPSFSIVAVGMVSIAIGLWRPQRFQKAITALIMLIVGCISLLSMLKVTNDPIVSNMWLFHRPYELTAIRWSDQYLHEEAVWTELNERLTVALDIIGHISLHKNRFVGFDRQPTTRVMVVSTITRLRSNRLHTPLPLPPDASQIYDNGEAQVYRLRPTTPFQK